MSRIKGSYTKINPFTNKPCHVYEFRRLIKQKEVENKFLKLCEVGNLIPEEQILKLKRSWIKSINEKIKCVVRK